MDKTIIYIMNDLKRGGSTKACFRTISYLNYKKKIILLNPKETDKDIKIKQKNIEFYSLDWRSLKKLNKSFFNIINLLNQDPEYIINCWLYKSILFGYILSIICGNKKLIWHIRHEDVNFRLRHFKKSILIRILSILSLTKFKNINIIYNSKKAFESHSKIGFKKNNIYIINNGFDVNKFKYEEKLKEKFIKKFKIKNDIFLISMFARFHPIKNHLIFFKAIQNILYTYPNIHIFLAGRYISNSNRNLIRLIKKYKLSHNITLGGLLNEEDLIGSYSATDLTVLTSNSESFPNVIGESMACTTPCLSFDVGDCDKIIGSSGWITRKNDLDDLISCIKKAIKLKSFENDWIKLKLDSRKNIKNLYSLDIEKRKYLDTFYKIINN